MTAPSSNQAAGRGSARLLATALAFCALTLLVAVGCGSDDSDRDRALATLALATQATELQSEMSRLVSGLSGDSSAEELERAGQRLAAIDRRAARLVVSAREEGSVPAAGELVLAGQLLRQSALGLGVFVRDPSGSRGNAAREQAEAGAHDAARYLRAALGEVRVALAGDGALSDEDGRTLARARRSVDDAEAVGTRAFASLAAGAPPPPAGAPPPAAGARAGPCGTVRGYPVVIEAGDVDCEEAVAVMSRYYDPSTPKEGSGASATVGDWFCISSSGGDLINGQQTVSRCEEQAGDGRIAALAS